MAVQRDSITVVPPDGETVVVDILEDDVSLGTVHADRSKTRTLTLPLTITARTSFFVPAGTGPYDVSVKLGDDEIAGADGTPVTVSSFPAEIHAKIDAAELGSVAGASGGSSTPPTSPVTNQLWYDSNAELWKRWDGSAWVAEGNAAYESVVVHGSTAATARPGGAVYVHWIGSVAPTNAVTNDEWTDTVGKVVSRFNGTGWDALGSGGFSPIQVSDLPAPLVVVHRGGANLFPENTMEAFRGAAALGATLIEAGDCCLLADGGVGIMHDTTVDRTTTASGNVSSFTTSAWQTLVADTDTYFGGGFGNLKVPLFSQVLGELGGKVVIVPEAKTGAGVAAKMATAIVHAGLQKSAIVQVGSLADAALVSAQGIAVMYTAVTGAEQTPANFVANGVGYVGAQSTSITDPTIAALHAVGIKVIGYTLDRQVDVAAWLARGGDGYFTNEPLYAAGASNGYAYQRTSMAFTAAYDHGEIENDTIGVRGLPTATAPAGIGWNDVAALGTRSMLLGPLSPAKGDPNANAFTFDFTYQWTSAANTGRWVGCFICCPTDAAVSGNGTDPAGADGYRCLITTTGLMEIAKYTNGANVGNLASASFSALTLPLALALRVTITPTTITFLDVTNSHSVSTNDTTYRGGFIHEAMSGCTARLIAASVS